MLYQYSTYTSEAQTSHLKIEEFVGYRKIFMSFLNKPKHVLSAALVGASLLLAACGTPGTMEDHIADLNTRIENQLNVLPDAKSVVISGEAKAENEKTILVEFKLANNPQMEGIVNDFALKHTDLLLDQAASEVNSTIGSSEIEELDVHLKIYRHDGSVLLDRTLENVAN